MLNSRNQNERSKMATEVHHIGKTTKFDDTELKTLAGALTDIGKKITQAAAFVF